MKILVILRQCPEMTEELELNEDSTDIDREWIGLVLNQFDDQALEQAVLLKERAGAEVVAIAIEDEGVDRMLKTALARGADTAYCIPRDEDAPRSSRDLAPVYADAIRQLGADLVLTGVLSVGDLFGELAPLIGAEMDWPQVSAVSDVAVDGQTIVVRQEYSAGRAASLAVDLPAVIGVQTASLPPRYVAGSKLRELLNVEIPQLPATADAPAATAMVVQLSLPTGVGGAEMISGDTDTIADGILAVLNKNGLL